MAFGSESEVDRDFICEEEEEEGGLLQAPPPQNRRISIFVSGVAAVACFGALALLTKDPSLSRGHSLLGAKLHRQNSGSTPSRPISKFEALPLLQTWISWQPETRSMIQKNSISDQTSSAPALQDIFSDPPKVKQLASILFRKVDARKDDSLDADEMTQAFKSLLRGGANKRMPIEAEVRQIEELAKGDMQIEPEEFVAVVAGTVQAMATGRHSSNVTSFTRGRPSVQELLQDSSKKKVSVDLFSKVGRNTGDSIERDEMAQGLQDLAQDGLLSTVANQIEGLTRDDMKT